MHVGHAGDHVDGDVVAARVRRRFPPRIGTDVTLADGDTARMVGAVTVDVTLNVTETGDAAE